MSDTLTPSRGDDLPGRGFTTLAQPVHSDTPEVTKSLVHVKLSSPISARIDGKHDFTDIEYVLVGTTRIDRPEEGPDGVERNFHYEETVVLGTDATGELDKDETVTLYKALRVLTLNESMFALGQL
jgi:hypothetical protein